MLEKMSQKSMLNHISNVLLPAFNRLKHVKKMLALYAKTCHVKKAGSMLNHDRNVRKHARNMLTTCNILLLK